MGGGKKPKAPPAPDYAALAKQQQASNQASYDKQLADMKASYEKQLSDSRATTQGPMGTSSWSQDANGQWVNTQTLTPELQQAYNNYLANQQSGQNVQKTALDQLAALQKAGSFQGPKIDAKFDQDYANQYGSDYAKTLLARITPQQQVDATNLDTKLKLQGLVPGTQAYDSAYQNLMKAQGDVTSQAQMQGQLQGQQQALDVFDTQLRSQESQYNQAMQEYMTPWQTAGMASGLAGNVNMPQFNPTTQTPGMNTPTLNTVDTMKYVQDNYKNQMDAYNSAASAKSGKGQSIGSLAGGVAGTFLMPGLGTAAGSAIGGALGSQFSDLRLKENVVQMSDEEAFHKLIEMAPIQWDWRNLGVADSGLAAQQLARRIPELTDMVGGHLRINYSGYVALLQGAFRHLAKELNHA